MSTKKEEKKVQKTKYLKVFVEDSEGNKWGELVAPSKNFKTGSVGYWAGGKLPDPENPVNRYQISCNFILIGSKPEIKKD